MRGASAAICPSMLRCCCSRSASMRRAISNSRERMSSSMPTSSSSRSAVCVCVRTSSSRCRSRAISPRMRSRSGFAAVCECPATIATSRTTASAAILPPRIVTQRMLGRLLLRLLFRRALAAGGSIADFHLDHESLVVIGAHFVDDVVFRKLQPLALCQLLERGLVVLEEKILRVDRIDIVSEGPFDQGASGIDSAVEIHSGDHRLEEIGQERFLVSPARLLLADAEVDDFSHAVVAPLCREAARAHQIRLHLREGPFVQRWKTPEQEVAHDESENGVAEKLEGLIVQDVVLPRLVRIGLVGECSREEIAALKLVPDALFEGRQVALHSWKV